MLRGMWGSVLAFSLVAALITITPGVDTALVIRNTLAGGRSVGLRTSAGVCTGLVTWGLLSALGVSAVVTASRVGFDILRFAGAAYLVYLGARSLLGTRRRGVEDAEPALPVRARAPYRNGLANNLLNPKIGVFYLTLLPQFVPAGTSALGVSVLLASINAVEAMIWLSVITVAVSCRVRS